MAAVASTADDAALLARLRADISSTRAHFNHAGMSLPPAPVLARVHAHLDLEAEIGGYEAEDAVAEELAELPARLAPLLGVEASEVTVTESATAASEMLLWSIGESFRYSAMDRILVDRLAYATAYGALHRRQSAGGAEVLTVPSQPDGTVDPDALRAVLDDRARLVLVTHMPTHVGTVTDIGEIGRIVAESGAIFAVDVAETLGQMPLDLGRLGCDVAFAPGRKFLRGPRGTGVAYIRASLADQLVPLTPPFGAIDGASPGTCVLPEGARRFGQFEFGVAARLGLGVAARYADGVGLATIDRLVVERSRAVVEMLDAFAAVTVVGGRDSRGIISFVHGSLDVHEVRARLGARGVNVWVNSSAGAPLDALPRSRLPSVRLSPHYVTSDDDLDRLRHGLEALG